MDEKIEKAIESLIDTSENASDGGEAMKFAQAALNLAHLKQVLRG